MDTADSSARLTTLPNLLGLARIAATPVVVLLMLLAFAGSGLLALVVFFGWIWFRERRRRVDDTRRVPEMRD